MLEEAGMTAEDAKVARAKLYAEGYQMARAWAAPQRDELRKSGLGAGYIDGMIAIVRREMLEAVGLKFVRTMEGEGDDSDAKVARRIKKGEGYLHSPGWTRRQGCRTTRSSRRWPSQ